MQTRALTEAALLTSIFVIMSLMAFYIPALSVIMVLVLGVPHALLTYRRGLRTGILAVTISFILLALLVDIIFALMLVILFAVVGLVLGLGAKHLSAGKTILLGAVAGSICFAILLFLVGSVTGIDIWGDMINSYQEALQIAADSNQLGTEIDIDEIQNQIDIIAKTLKPALVIIFGFMTAYINYRMFQVIGRRFKINVPRMPSLFEWHFPKWVGLLYFAGFILTRFAPEASILQTLGMNVNTIFYWPVLLQGLSLIVMFFGRYIRSKIFYIILAIMIFTNPLLQMIVIFIGMFDMFFDYRGWVQEKGENK